jgi:nitrogen fixation protein NifZ
MIDARQPRYEWGQRVTAALNLYNDGSYPDEPPQALLVRAGDPGEIVQVGTHTETHTPVYLVEFNEHHVVGCLEEEIAPA